jgi:hypothetical protein
MKKKITFCFFLFIIYSIKASYKLRKNIIDDRKQKKEENYVIF